MAGEDSTTEAANYPRDFSRDIDWKWPIVPARKLVTLNCGRALKADTRSPGKVLVFGTNGQCGWHDTPLAKGPGLILGRKGQGSLCIEWRDKDFWVIDTAYYASTLAPDWFQDSEVGHIPKGWTIQPVDEVVDWVKSGMMLPTPMCVGGFTGAGRTFSPLTGHWRMPGQFSTTLPSRVSLPRRVHETKK
jgi:hypothetical protein